MLSSAFDKIEFYSSELIKIKVLSPFYPISDKEINFNMKLVYEILKKLNNEISTSKLTSYFNVIIDKK